MIRNGFWKFLVFVPLLAAGSSLRAADIHSNGTGGGPWSDPATWRGNGVPGPDDSVTIAAHDLVTFDREDDARRTCLDLYIDPKGSILFKPGGKRVLSIAGPLESYGLIKLDASGGADSLAEIRFVGPTLQRQLKLAKGGALIASGRAGLADGKRNVILSSRPAPPAPPATAPAGKVVPAPPPVPYTELLASITCVAGTSLDLRYARLEGITIQATKIDNTGAKNNERVNIANCAFTDSGSLTFEDCDTPAIVNNTFEHVGAQIPVNAIYVGGCPLAEIRGNVITGKYTYGIHTAAQTDSVVSDNVLNDCVGGMYCYGTNEMLKGITVHGANVGIVVTSWSGALENITFDNCNTGLLVAGATAQATNLRFQNVPKGGDRIHFTTGPLTLVNCDLTPEQITMEKGMKLTPAPRVTAMQYCVVAVKGQLPTAAAVDAATANPPAPLAKGAVDPNVLNGPAVLDSRGLTPLPASLKPLTLKSWVIQGDGSITPPPVYNMSVTAKADTPNGEPKRVKTVTATPGSQWYRAESDDLKPTLEIVLP